MRRPTIYVTNRGAHDFSAAIEWGELCFMSEGSLNRYATAQMYRAFDEHLSHSQPTDYLLLTGLGVMNAVACAMFAARHHRLNLLLFKDGRYVERKLILTQQETLNELPQTSDEGDE